jgi:hypothetical protein
MKYWISIYCAALLLGSLLSSSVHAQVHSLLYEDPRLPSIGALLPAELVKGPHHQVTKAALRDGYFISYTITSPFGEYTADGRQLLEIRIGELAALAELDKLSSSKVFKDAALEAGEATLMAPVKLVEKTYERVSDPDKAVETLQSIPEGAERLFSWAYDQIKGATHSVREAVAPGPTPTPDPYAPDSGISGAWQTGKKFGLKYIGYSKREREWFKKLKVSPYTSNERLRSEVERVAGVETAVGVGFKFIPGLGLLGQLSTVNHWYERAEKLALFEEPSKITEKNIEELKNLEIDAALAKRFLQTKAYGPWSSRFIIASLTAIGPEVKGHGAFLAAACEATNEHSALYFVSVAEALEQIHSRQKLRQIVSTKQLPAGITERGTLILPLSVDYLFWTEEVARILQDFQKQAAHDWKFSSTEILIRGLSSEFARQRLTKLGAKVAVGRLS